MPSTRRRPLLGALIAAAGLVLLAALALRWADDPTPTPTPPPLAVPAIPPPDQAAQQPLPLGRQRLHTTPGPALGAVLMLHGGGFAATTPAGLDSLEATAQQLAAWGYDAHLIPYHAGLAGGPDIHAAVLRLSASYGGRLCVYGESAGGFWALRAAQVLPDRIRCAVGAAALTRLDIPASGAFAPDAHAAAIVAASFGDPATRQAQSPLTHAAANATPTLLMTSSTDRLIRSWQAYDYAAAQKHTQVVDIPGGDRPWVHGGISLEGGSAAQQALRAFLDASQR